jgi:pyruvate dehydrogenase E1 component alpha subunit
VEPAELSAPRRTATLGQVEGLAEASSRERTLAIWRRMCLVRHFDLRVRRAHETKEIEALVYLSVGQEAIAAALGTVMEGALVLGQHRAHSLYLAFGGRPERLVDELLGLSTGCCGGVGGSPPIHDLERGIIGHSGLIGDHVPIAAGVALARPESRVVCVFGDGAAEEDYVLGAFGMIASRKLPVLLVCEDNDLSVLTPTAVRRTWEVARVAESFGIPSVDVADDPWLIAHWAERWKDTLPALLNVRTCRELWHVGTGCDGPPEWNRWALVGETLARLGLAGEAQAIERDVQAEVERLWDERLRTRFAS